MKINILDKKNSYILEVDGGLEEPGLSLLRVHTKKKKKLSAAMDQGWKYQSEIMSNSIHV